MEKVGLLDFSTKAFSEVTKLSPKSDNVLFSPVSLNLALGLVGLGASGDTERELWGVLGFKDGNEAASYFKQLQTQLKTDSGGKLQFILANRIWIQKDYPIEKPFLKACLDNFGAEPDVQDFLSDPAGAAAIINKWIEIQTKEKIKNVVNARLVEKAKLVVANGTYLKALWTNPFEKTGTAEKPFHLDSKSQVNAPFMHQKKYFKVAEDANVTVLEMGYMGEGADEKFNAWVILPHKNVPLSTTISQLSAKKLSEWAEKLEYREVSLALPKFKFGSFYSLVDGLKPLGINLLFDRLQGTLGRASLKKPSLYVSQVVQKSILEVNESGTEAAAATVLTAVEGGGRSTQKPMPVNVDRPFLFLVRHGPTETILFMAAVRNPLKAGEGQ